VTESAITVRVLASNFGYRSLRQAWIAHLSTFAPYFSGDVGRILYDAARMDERAVLRAAQITVRRAILQRFPLGGERERWLAWAQQSGMAESLIRENKAPRTRASARSADVAGSGTDVTREYETFPNPNGPPSLYTKPKAPGEANQSVEGLLTVQANGMQSSPKVKKVRCPLGSNVSQPVLAVLAL
jgi:cell division septation protein DedD